jgi:OmpA-OmpF porin, OOP family
MSVSVNCPVNRSSQRGQSATPILVFVGIVSLSVIFFFVFTLPQCGGKQPPKTIPTVATPAKTGTPTTPTPVPVVNPLATPEPTIPVAPPKPFFMKSSQFLTAIAEKLTSGKATETLEWFAPSVAPAKRAFFEKVFAAGYTPVTTESPWREIGRMSAQERWALLLQAPAAAAVPGVAPVSAPATTPLEFDLKLTRENGYQITNVRFSPALMPLAGPNPEPGLVDAPDPLTISNQFITEVLGKDFRGARSITDNAKVTHEKLAGLCIVFEEGEYKMIPGSSLNVTAATPERAWALVRVRSPKTNTESEFGVEMSRTPTNEWKVDSLDFSKLLQTYVQATDAGKVYYSPVVKSPGGGESLVVYFEYDRAEITDRGLRQLEIVADLLKSDPARKMRLSGYADAKGTEDYNYQLSKRRAIAVQAKLNELGVNPAQVESRGFGSEAPLDPNLKEDGTDNPEGRSRNRRTEIYLDF